MFKDNVENIYAKNFPHTHIQGYPKIRNFSPGLLIEEVRSSNCDAYYKHLVAWSVLVFFDS